MCLIFQQSEPSVLINRVLTEKKMCTVNRGGLGSFFPWKFDDFVFSLLTGIFILLPPVNITPPPHTHIRFHWKNSNKPIYTISSVASVLLMLLFSGKTKVQRHMLFEIISLNRRESYRNKEQPFTHSLTHHMPIL